VNDCCLTPNEQFFSNIINITSSISMRWWWWLWCPLCTRPTRLVGLSIVLAHWKKKTAGRHFAHFWHIIMIPSQPVLVNKRQNGLDTSHTTYLIRAWTVQRNKLQLLSTTLVLKIKVKHYVCLPQLRFCSLGMGDLRWIWQSC
jgi:hypothetical protein